jgi:proton-coupled amino acid transporter
MLYSPVAPTASALQQPGAFRRQFITNKAKKEGKRPPNFLTSNFIDFLVLYGYFGGDVYPSDDDDSDSEEDRLPGSVPTDLEHQSENAPLLERQSSTNLAAIKGTSQAKAFFMLLKAFVGTGILFLPKAFSNGGILFSSICMVGFGFLTMHCMILLVEASRSFGGKSFGDLGQIIYGEKCRLLILGSIAVSQMVNSIFNKRDSVVRI